MSHHKELLKLLIQAYEHQQQKDNREALVLYHKAVERFGANPHLFVAIALCHYRLTVDSRESEPDHGREAISWMSQAVTMEPNRGAWHYLLGEMYQIIMNDYEHAAQEFRRAIELNPHNAQELFNAASLYEYPEKVVTLEEVIGWLEHATEVAPQDPHCRFRLGEFYHRAGRSSEAEEEWIVALSWCSQTPYYQGFIGTIREAIETDEE